MAESPARGLSRSLVSRWLSRVDRFASRPLAAIFVVTAAGTWIIVSIAAGYPARWETIFQTVVAVLTLAMAIPGTDNALLTLEHASDDELHAAGSQHRSIRQAALEDHPAPGSGDAATRGSS